MTEPPSASPSTPSYQISVVSWESHRDALSAVRFEVFVEEQSVPPEVELDDMDPVCTHVLARAHDGEPIGCGRLLPDGHIGRMAVRKAWRGQGVGLLLLEALINEAHARGLVEALLSSQVHATGFYERAGFVAYGPVYDDVGIPHRDMRRALR